MFMETFLCNSEHSIIIIISCHSVAKYSVAYIIATRIIERECVIFLLL